MNYILTDLRAILLAEGYTNIFINHLPENAQRIVIMDNGGATVDSNQPIVNKDVTIYVRDTKPSTARLTAENLFKFLQNFVGKHAATDDNVYFNKIKCTPIQYWGYNEKTKSTEFAFNASLLNQDTDLTKLQ